MRDPKIVDPDARGEAVRRQRFPEAISQASPGQRRVALGIGWRVGLPADRPPAATSPAPALIGSWSSVSSPAAFE